MQATLELEPMPLRPPTVNTFTARRSTVETPEMSVYRRSGWRGALPNSREREDEPTVQDINGLILTVAEQRDRTAFRQIFAHFAPRLLGFLQKQGSQPQMAEEMVQETMVNVWRKAVQFDPAKAAASTWIFTIARNARIDHLRKNNRPAIDETDPALVPEQEPAAHYVMSRRQETDRLMQVVGKLPTDQREVLKLAFFQEKAHGEVAKELGIPLGTVKSRIRLALKKIRGELGES